jgi:hypothetical protein
MTKQMANSQKSWKLSGLRWVMFHTLRFIHLDLNKYNVFFNKFSDLFKIFKSYKSNYILVFTTFKTEVVPVLNSAPYQEGKGGTGGVAACIVINLCPRWEVSGQLHMSLYP